MLTSVFSHQTFLHFAFNNYALWSFGGSALIVAAHHAASYRSGAHVPEASPTPHFLAFFATAGVFAATVSHIVAAVRFRRISALHGLDVARAALGRQGSLGASGAVYAAVVMSACAFPDAQLGIIFLPFITFPIGAGVAGLVAADVAGVLLRWRMFDHWAHLGGAAFGWVYWWYGAEAWERLKRVLVERLRMGARGAVEQR
uniref:Peptidase S54 rhomboid domain-containing protein n=2 Tax=Kalmanozyma brasiliensis (strain GHG001) TaxID=1365824 RepID=V5GRR1_KALBG